MDLEYFARLLKVGISTISGSEETPASAVEDSLATTASVSPKQMQEMKAARLAPDQSSLEALATAFQSRASFNDEWLYRFLLAGGHKHPQEGMRSATTLAVPAAGRRVGAIQNLPAPTYAKYVSRHHAFAELQNALAYRLPVVAIVSLGGMGKSSLAREAAEQLLQDTSRHTKFEAAVWVSDKEHAGTTTLGRILDTIARVLDYPGYINYLHDQKQMAIDDLLRRTRTLVVVDNFDTITDNSVAEWLKNLPEPSKAILTTRSTPQLIPTNAMYVLQLQGMNEGEQNQFVHNHLEFLGLDSTSEYPPDLKRTLAILGGNPFAIELTLGLLKHHHKTLIEIVTDLEDGKGKVFDILIGWAWALLGDFEKRLLRVMHIFPHGADLAALPFVAELVPPASNQALDHLLELSLIRIHRRDLQSAPRASVHTLVYAFVGAELKLHGDLYSRLWERALVWYLQMCAEIGFCWNDVSKLKRLDIDGERETIESVMHWAYRQRRLREFITLSCDMRYFYYVRGVWSHPFDTMRADASKELGDAVGEFDALVYHINIASKQGNHREAEQYLPRLDELAASGSVPTASLIDYQHAMALYRLSLGQHSEARALWESNLRRSDLSSHALITNRRWLGVCLFLMGQLDAAEQLFRQVLDDAKQHDFARAGIAAETYLAQIEMNRGDYQAARPRLNRALEQAMVVDDRRARADINKVRGRLYAATGDIAIADHAFADAVDGLERLGAMAEADLLRREQHSLLSATLGSGPVPGAAS
jgi:tetratricopeptide (TPR) repeat protein